MSAAYRNPDAKERPDLACHRLAAAQHGVLSRLQALNADMTKSGIQRRLSSGEWITVLPGVYRMTSVPTSWHQELSAAVLWAGPCAAASHRAAAALRKLDGFPRNVIEIVTTKNLRHPAIEIHRVEDLPPGDLAVVEGILTTNAARTLLDLGAVAPPGLVELAVEDALRRGLVSLPRLRWTLQVAGGRGKRGTQVLRALLGERPKGTPSTESPLEIRLLQKIRVSGLPLPLRQYEIKDGGEFVARVDLAYPGAMLAIEGDSFKHHSGRRAWNKDLARRNSLTALGWRVIHVTWEDLKRRPEEIIEQIRQALGGQAGYM